MYRFMKGLSAFICLLPKSIQYAIGALIGHLAWWGIPGKRRKLAIGQILFCGITKDYKEAEVIAKESVKRFGPMIIDVLRYPEIKDGRYRDMVEFSGREILDDIHEAGKGAIICALHSGNWELLGGVLASEGYPLISVAMKQSDDSDRFINEYRALMRQHVTYKTGVREMISELKKGSMIGLIMDQDPGKTGILAPFFGYETLTATGPAVLARMEDVPIVPITIHYDPYKEKHCIEVHTPLWMEKTENKKADILLMTIRLNEFLEDHIRRYPEDWFWLHNRWKWTRYIYGETLLVPPDAMNDRA